MAAELENKGKVRFVENTEKKEAAPVAEEKKPSQAEIERLERIQAIIKNDQISKAEKVRQLLKLGMTRGSIAKALDTRFQYVYQISRREAEKQKAKAQNA